MRLERRQLVADDVIELDSVGILLVDGSDCFLGLRVGVGVASLNGQDALIDELQDSMISQRANVFKDENVFFTRPFNNLNLALSIIKAYSLLITHDDKLFERLDLQMLI